MNTEIISILSMVLDDLRKGKIETAIQNHQVLNQAASYFLANSPIPELEILIRICNILYNRTDMTVLPIEDGIYDLLLEHYKKINPNFQVGSEMVPFMVTNNIQEEKHCPLIFHDKDEYNRYQNGVYVNNLGFRKDFYRNKSFVKNPLIFHNNISKRIHNTSHNHPSLVGTLDKAKFVLCQDAEDKGVLNDSNVKVLERDFFAKHIKMGVIRPDEKLEIIIELKYDGISVESDCNRFVQSARTRGDTGIEQASDITPILYGYPFPYADFDYDDLVGIKWEAIMTYDDLHRFNLARNSSYINCRTAIIGLFGSSDGSLYRDYITLVPLAVDAEKLIGEEVNREVEIEFLNKYYATKACPLRYVKVVGDYKQVLFQIREFLHEAEVARRYLNFMYDGIVVSYNDPKIRRILGRENSINKYSMAVKFNPLELQTRFLGYSYTVGSSGTITPMIHYDPISFFGAVMVMSSGHSYDRFKKLNLAIGDIINVEYTNDVMARVTGKVNCSETINNPNNPVEFPTICPICGSKLVFTEKSAICNNPLCSGRVVSRLVNSMKVLNIDGLAEANIKSLKAIHLSDFFKWDISYYNEVLGEANANKVFNQLQELIKKPTPDYIWFGALGFSGIATKTWKLIFERMTAQDFIHFVNTKSLYVPLSKIHGIGNTTIEIISRELDFFRDDIDFIMKHANIVVTKGVKTGPSVVCTGFRDKEFMKFLRSKGYDAPDDGTVTKSTSILLVPYDGFSSSKTKKIGESTKIISVGKFKEELNYG